MGSSQHRVLPVCKPEPLQTYPKPKIEGQKTTEQERNKENKFLDWQIETERVGQENPKKSDGQTDDYGNADRLEKIGFQSSMLQSVPYPFLSLDKPYQALLFQFLRKRATLTDKVLSSMKKSLFQSSRIRSSRATILPACSNKTRKI